MISVKQNFLFLTDVATAGMTAYARGSLIGEDTRVMACIGVLTRGLWGRPYTDPKDSWWNSLDRYVEPGLRESIRSSLPGKESYKLNCFSVVHDCTFLTKHLVIMTVAVGILHGLGVSAVALTAAKVAQAALIVIGGTLALHFFKPVIVDDEARIITSQDTWASALIRSTAPGVLAATMFGWNPVIFGATGALNGLAERYGVISPLSCVLELDQNRRVKVYNADKSLHVRNHLAMQVKRICNGLAITAVAMGALHLAGKVVMKNPQTRVVAAVAYLVLANMDPYKV